MQECLFARGGAVNENELYARRSKAGRILVRAARQRGSLPVRWRGGEHHPRASAGRSAGPPLGAAGRLAARRAERHLVPDHAGGGPPCWWTATTSPPISVARLSVPPGVGLLPQMPRGAVAGSRTRAGMTFAAHRARKRRPSSLKRSAERSTRQLMAASCNARLMMRARPSAISLLDDRCRCDEATMRGLEPRFPRRGGRWRYTPL